MEDDSSLRLVQKLFKCPLCLRGFKKLVHVNEQFSKCPECGHEHCSEMINSEFNRESVDSQYRLPFCNLPEDVRRQYHTVTDIHDKSPNNFYLDARRNESQNTSNNNTNNNNYSNNYNYSNNTYNNTIAIIIIQMRIIIIVKIILHEITIYSLSHLIFPHFREV